MVQFDWLTLVDAADLGGGVGGGADLSLKLLT